MYHKFPTPQAPSLEIYQMAPPLYAWDISSMASRRDKKADAERRARALYTQLLLLKPAELTERQWTIGAGVSSSFFTNLKAGSEPSIGNLRLVLDFVGITLPEFFAPESKGRLLRAPNEPELIAALSRVLPHLPSGVDRQAEFLASTVSGVLGLPANMRTRIANDDDGDSGGPEADAPTRAATK